MGMSKTCSPICKVSNRRFREVSYIIANACNDKVLDIDSDNPSSGDWVKMQPYSCARSQNRWEFERPITAFRPGWLHIQNVGTGDLLSQDYDHNPPVLLPAPEPLVESQYRRQWQFQWALAHSKCFRSGTSGEPNSWYIINRLTRMPLSPHLGRMVEKDFEGREENLAWKVELDTSKNWKITNLKTSCLLQQTGAIRIEGAIVGCSQQRFLQTGGKQCWILG